MNSEQDPETRKFNPSYISPRPDVEELIQDGCRLVLDVGCSVGTLGASIKQSKACRVFGIEISEPMAREATRKLDHVFIGTAEEGLRSEHIKSNRFDTIIFADVLEHLSDPWTTLSEAVTLLAPGGSIVISLPNVRHADTVWNLVFRGEWPYRDRGIHDRTHLRFFTLKNAQQLIKSAGLKVEYMRTHYRIIERPHDWNRFAHRLAIPGLREFLAFQYVFRTTKA